MYCMNSYQLKTRAYSIKMMCVQVICKVQIHKSHYYLNQFIISTATCGGIIHHNSHPTAQY